MGTTPFLEARRESCENTSSVRPKVANIGDTETNHKGSKSAVGEQDEREIIWWKPRERKEE